MVNRIPTVDGIESAFNSFPAELIAKTPLVRHEGLSQEFDADIWLKKEMEQPIGSYKVRGAFNAALHVPRNNGHEIVCASAGNHAQGVAASSKYLGHPAHIFMPKITPAPKVEATRRFGGENVEISLVGDTFAEAARQAHEYAEARRALFIHPFNDPHVIEGQGTVGLEILEQQPHIDYVLAPVGGGGLVSGIATYMKHKSPDTKVIGVEPKEAAAMRSSIDAGRVVTLDRISTLIESVAVNAPGALTFALTQKYVDDILTVSENHACDAFLRLHETYGIHVELAGALPVAALDVMRNEIRGKTVACVLSGRNFDMRNGHKYAERAELHRGRLKYIRIRLPDRPGALHNVTSLMEPANITYLYHDSSQEDTGVLMGLESATDGVVDAAIQRLRNGQVSVDDISGHADLHTILRR
ncbi:MAG TPA: pyridoxal-phosphate dependent enzyme [Candidatus Peribacteraceae bacterium]|nr:pyridoxal-phosphate dependent enzyme [Candidatus Peribacteraceae bacterium]